MSDRSALAAASSPADRSTALAGRLAVVTGAAGPVGSRFSARLLALGARVVLVDHPRSPLSQVCTALAEHGDRVVPAPVDLLDADAVAQVGAAARGAPADVLVNNAAFTGTSGLPGYAVPFEEQTPEAFGRALQLNLTVPFALTALVRRDAPAGAAPSSIINVASIYGLVGPNLTLYEGTTMGNPAAYAASKGGLIQLTRYLAAVLAPAVRVNVIAPGGIARGQDPQFVERYEKLTPMGRMATEDDLLGALTWLATDESAFVTGQTIAVDGGWTTW
jgi:NAD(P)-dependent dehydrogenase (short-subunit alcohol dehydrogenase family)